MQSYYYRAGQRRPVRIATGAFTVAEPAEGFGAEHRRWSAWPIAKRLSLVADQSLLGPAPADRGDAVRRIALCTQRPHLLELGDSPVDRPHPWAMPVALSDDGHTLLCPTGAVLARFPTDRDPRPQLSACGWRVDRPIRFLERGWVLRPEGDEPTDPLTLANALVEEAGCLFAHPVFLEEKVPRARAARAWTPRVVGM